jgi:hypothetical protein
MGSTNNMPLHAANDSHVSAVRLLGKVAVFLRCV